MYSIGTGR